MPLKVLLSLNAFNVPCSDKNMIIKKKIILSVLSKSLKRIDAPTIT